MKTRILVTGGTGFLGARLVAALEGAGTDVVAPSRGPALGRGGATSPHIESIETADWSSMLPGVDVVIHLAAVAHTGDASGADYERVNADATIRLARAAEGRIRRFVFVSSIRAVTGPTCLARLDENTPTSPTDAYGRAKLRAERALASFSTPTTILRPVVVYGAGAKGNLALIARLAASGLPLPFAGLTAPRSFLAADNAVAAMSFAASRATPGAEVFGLADPAPADVATLLKELRGGLGAPARLFSAPRAALAAIARMAGRGEAWSTLSGPLAVDVGKLISAGWRPPIKSTDVGARLWGEALRKDAGR